MVVVVVLVCVSCLVILVLFLSGFSGGVWNISRSVLPGYPFENFLVSGVLPFKQEETPEGATWFSAHRPLWCTMLCCHDLYALLWGSFGLSLPFWVVFVYFLLDRFRKMIPNVWAA